MDILTFCFRHPYRRCINQTCPRRAWQFDLVAAVALAGLVVLVGQRSLIAEPPAAVASPNGLPWVQTFSNDFTTSAATQDLAGWTKLTGDGSQYGIPGWGNSELEIYSSAASNLNVSNGALNINAHVQTDNHGVTTATSARITTQGLFSQTYGLFQFTASVPSGSGLWPAFWMMPAGNAYGGWPTSGEIDVMESGSGGSAQANTKVQGSFHSGPSYDISQTKVYSSTGFNTQNSNTYDVLWLPGTTAHPAGTLQWYVNGSLYETQNGGWYKPPGATDANAPFDQPFYLIMNLAVGGPGTPYTGGATPQDGTYTMSITDVEAFALPVAGDFDRNGKIDVGDVPAMMNALSDESDFATAHGLTLSQLALLGDVNGDGKFTNADSQALLANLGSISGGGSITTVPEPASFVLLALGGLGFWRRKSLACRRPKVSIIC